MWSIRETEEYHRKLKQFAKKHRTELLAMLANLDTYVETLQAGVNPNQVRHGFTHDETHGAIAIDQRGAAGKPRQTRLYLYPDAETQTIYLITIGDKNSQRQDNASCRELILHLRELKPSPIETQEQIEQQDDHDKTH